MKKTISINIAGLIFHIEEDAYDRLNHYLNEVTRYFASYEDIKEIVSDIESRIAELLLQKLGNTRQAVSMEDVDQVISTMGTTTDFAAAEDHDHEENSQFAQQHAESVPKTKFFRDTQRKLIGGVLSGIAYHLQVDPFWIRLAVLAFFFGMFFLPPIPGFILLAYIILWIVMPANSSLKSQKVKKLFRDPDNKVIAGVCSGIAAYFKIDVVPVRLVFVLLIFLGGTGLIAYILIWAISPKAVTIADKLEMEGSPVTLSNIEQTVKQRLQSPEVKEETLLVKALLLPFRLLSTIFTKGAQALGPLFGFLWKAIRILFGIFLIAVGLSLLIGTLAMILSYLDIWTYGIHLPDYFSLHLIRELIPASMITGGALLVGIPSIALILSGIRSVVVRPLVPRAVSISLLLLWLAGIILSTLSTIPLVNQFKEKGSIESERFYPIDTLRTLVLDARLLGNKERASLNIPVQIRGYEGTDLKMVQKIYSMGSNPADARVNASYLNIALEVEDTSIVLPYFATLAEKQQYRGQHAKIFLYIPYNQSFIITSDLADQLQNTLTYQGYRQSDADGKSIWSYDSTGKLLCSGCPDKPRPTGTAGFEIDEEVNTLVAGDNFDIRIQIGDDPSVRIYAKDIDKEDISAEIRGGRLELNRNRSWNWEDASSKEILVEIVTPSLKEIELNGIAKAELSGFIKESILIELNGASNAKVNGSFENMVLDINGTAGCDLSGMAEKIEASMAGASRLNASDFKSIRMELQTSGAANAEVWVEEQLKVESSGVSQVRYRGNAKEIRVEESGVSSIKRID